MRIRTIKPEFWTDSTIVTMPIEVRLIFIGLWNASDDHGWLPDDAMQLRLQILPADSSVNFEAALELLICSGRVGRYYFDDGSRALRIEHWEKHQRVDHPGKSKIAREGSRKLAIHTEVRRMVADKYGCKPGCEVDASCYYCGAQGSVTWHKLSNGRPSFWVTFNGLELDHFEPEYHGGEGVAENIVLACRACNRSKGILPPDNFIFVSRETSRVLAPEQGTGNREQGMEQGIEGKGVKGKTSRTKLTDDEWLATVRTDPAYEEIDVMKEHGKMIFWCANKHKQPTRGRFLAWLNRIEKPMSGAARKPESNMVQETLIARTL